VTTLIAAPGDTHPSDATALNDLNGILAVILVYFTEFGSFGGQLGQSV